jgi:radical SAM protein with 4Fe4S-binding SPASM domain
MFDMDEKYPILNDNFVIREWEKITILINFQNGEYFELTNEQAIVLQYCNGNNELKFILKTVSYAKDALEFLNNLETDNIISFNIEKRKIPKRITKKTDTNFSLTDALFEITGYCNLQCKHCYNSAYNKETVIKDELKINDWKNVVKQMDKLGIRRIQISGGEPFTVDNWHDLVRYIKNTKIFIDAIASNATLITEDIAKELATLMKTFGAVYVSLDGVNKETHDELRGIGNFDKTIQSIKLLEKHNVNVVINTMLINQNKDNLLDFHSFIQNKFSNVKGWRIGCPKILGNYVENYQDFYVKYTDAIDVFCKLLKKYLLNNATYRLEMSDYFRSEVLEYGFEEYSLVTHPCEYAIHNCTIKPNGDVLFCASLEGFEGAKLGNVKDIAIKKMWESETHNKIQNLKISDINFCPECKFVKMCGTGCRSNSFLANNTITEPDFRACISMLNLDKEIIPMLPKNLQKQWHGLLNKSGKIPLLNTIADVL